MTEQEGQSMCDAVIREWKRRVRNRWPMVEEQCAYSLGHMILRGSRMTGDGLKISYHIIYPWLVFPCNTTMLHDEVGTMSEMPQFQYITATGVRKSFIDPGVYTSNRQFRMLLCNKLSDKSQTALRLSCPPTISMFVRSCITNIGDKVAMIPPEEIPRGVSGKRSKKRPRTAGADTTRSASNVLIPHPLHNFLLQLLQKQGQPSGTLTFANESQHEYKLRWQVLPDLTRPCMTAQIWRPSQASHKSNGAWVSIDRYGGVYLTCLHPQCLKRGHCNRRLLGQAPLSLLAQLNDSGTSQAPSQDEAGCDTLLSGLADAVQQPSSGHKHRKDSTRRQASSPETPPAPLTEDYGLTTLAGPDEEPDTTAILSDTPSIQRLRKLTREQSIKRVEIENQQSKKEPFQPWTVEPGPWGGRIMAPQTGI